MRIRFYNARILTMEKGDAIFHGELHVEENRISYVGEQNEFSIIDRGKWDEEIDCNGNLIMPGFKNAHSHSPMTFLRSYADDLPLQKWLYERIFPMEAKLTDEDIQTFTKLAILEYLTSGITSNFDMYLDNRNHAKVSLDYGYRTVFCGSINDHVGSPSWLRNQYDTINNMGELVSLRLGLHAEYTTKKETIEAVADMAHEMKQPVFLHLAETEKEVKECKERYGKTPVAFLESLGLFDYGGGGYHGVWLTKEDCLILAKRKVSIVTCPGSNIKLASGIADLYRLQKYGITLGIGTDGPASNNALDMFREMYLAAVLTKVKREDAAVLDARNILHMATRGSAQVMGLHECETLKPGQLADLIMLDLHRPNMQPEHDIEKNIVYSGSKQNVKLTMVNGKILYRDGEFYLPESEEEIYVQVKYALSRLKKR